MCASRSYEFVRSILDSISEHIVVIDNKGDIHFVNSSWVNFGQKNSCVINDNWTKMNYLEVCDKAAAMGDESALKAAKGIRKVIDDKQKLFYLEYPCHGPDEKRWFVMKVTSFQLDNVSYYVILHQNITQRKIAEEKILHLSRIDGLTNIANRRYFDEFLNNEWRRCRRLKMPITLAIIDIDHFKLLNDTYGHQAGDQCLKEIGSVIKSFTKRPSDICARYGGEEFSMVLGNTTFEKSLDIVNRLLNAIRELRIPNRKSPTMPIVTVSIGTATVYPNEQGDEKKLIKAADLLLYSAKEKGRNQVVSAAM